MGALQGLLKKGGAHLLCRHAIDCIQQPAEREAAAGALRRRALLSEGCIDVFEQQQRARGCV